MTTTTPYLTLIPYPTTQQTTAITPIPIPIPVPTRPANNLDEEITEMRGAMRLIFGQLSDLKDLGRISFHANTLARLSDSIVRALLASQKLHAADQQTEELRAEIERIFRELGWTQHP